MKKMILIVFVLSTNVCYGQTWAEWFRQNKTQKKYLIQQIAALQVYIDFAHKGYGIVKDGLNAIGDLKNGELNLHAGYFAGLRSASPKVKKYADVLKIVKIQMVIHSKFSEMISIAKSSLLFTEAELSYLFRVRDRVFENCVASLEQLNMLCSSDYEMTDDERMAGIQKVHRDFQDDLSYTINFTDGVRRILLSKNQQLNDTETLKKLYRLNEK